MKTGIHPQVHKDAKTTCSNCSTVFLIPSTVLEQTVETCRICHHIYTGKQQKETRGGRVDRFRKRLAASAKKED